MVEWKCSGCFSILYHCSLFFFNSYCSTLNSHCVDITSSALFLEGSIEKTGSAEQGQTLVQEYGEKA